MVDLRLENSRLLNKVICRYCFTNKVRPSHRKSFERTLVVFGCSPFVWNAELGSGWCQIQGSEAFATLEIRSRLA